MVTVKVKRLNSNVELPKYVHLGDAGMDVRSTVDYAIAPGVSAVIPTGLAFSLPSGYEIQVRPRSGLAAKHAVTVLNSPGTLDEQYRGELKIILINHSKSNTFHITKGDRIAQIVLNKFEQFEFDDVDFK